MQWAEVLVATTWRCNLRCAYCFVRESNLTQHGDGMSPEMAVRLVDALDEGLAHAESIGLHLYGGEPLLNLPAMEAMLHRAGEKGPGRFSFAITTNGTCLSSRAIALLRAGDFQIILSLDGPAPVHDACRRTADGRPTHQQVLAFFDALRAQTDCWIRGSAVVRSGWGLGQATDYLRSLPFDTIKAQAVRGPAGTPYGLSPEEKAAYLQDLAAVGRQVIDEVEAGQMPRDDRFSNRVLQLLAGKKRQTFCGAGESTFGVTPSGQILPCVLMEVEGNLLGHVDDQPSAWVQAGRRWRTSQPVRSECEACAAFDLCGGGCPAMMPICGPGECDIIAKNCQVARGIFDHFRDRPEMLLTLAGIP